MPQRSRDEEIAHRSSRRARIGHRRFDWSNYQPPVPEFSGRGVYAERSGERSAPRSLETLIPYIDWSPFFHTWELRGRYPAIFDDPTVGKQARELFDDAQKLLERIVAEKLLTARGVFGFWPANSVGDDVELYHR